MTLREAKEQTNVEDSLNTIGKERNKLGQVM